MTASQLRSELSARNRALACQMEHDLTSGRTPSVVYAPVAEGHGNFLRASWQRIQANPQWRRRLAKAYTAGQYLPRRHDRRRGELECANSSDALLMNIFCYPGLLRRPAACHLLGITPGERPRFGVRVATPLTSGHTDRTEVDLVLGDLLVEAKLTETGFQTARASLLTRYAEFYDVFDTDQLLRSETGVFFHYQLLRGVLAAHALQVRFALFCDARRTDLIEDWFSVLQTVRDSDLRSRLKLVTWQELSATGPRPLQRFLEAKYGIFAPGVNLPLAEAE